MKLTWDFPDSPVIKTVLPLQGVWVPSLVKKVGIHQKKKKKTPDKLGKYYSTYDRASKYINMERIYKLEDSKYVT